jgi:hypothetical protein
MPFGEIAAGISAGTGLLGGLFQSGAASSAQKAAQQALTQQRNDLAPFRTAGTAAVGDASDLLGLNGQDAATAAMGKFQQSPGYQFSRDQGLRAVDAGASATGMLRSGATIKAEDAFGTGLADQEFGNYYNRVKGLADLGETAAAGGATTANTSANAALIGGNAQSSIYGNTAAGLGTTVNGLLANPNFQNWWSGGTNAISGSPYTPSYTGVPSPY